MEYSGKKNLIVSCSWLFHGLQHHEHNTCFNKDNDSNLIPHVNATMYGYIVKYIAFCIKNQTVKKQFWKIKSQNYIICL